MNDDKYMRLIVVLALMLLVIFLLHSGFTDILKARCDDTPEMCDADVNNDGF